MASKWLIITLAGIFIASAVTIGVLVFLIKKSEKEEEAADRLYLKQKEELLQKAVATNLNDGSGAIQTSGSSVLTLATDTKDEVSESNSKLAGIISNQKAVLKDVEKRYANEMGLLFP